MLSVFAGFETESSDYAEIPDIDNDYASLTRITDLFFSYRVFDLLRAEKGSIMISKLTAFWLFNHNCY